MFFFFSRTRLCQSTIFLGHLYQKGFGIPQDYVMAEKWYKKSMEQGDDSGHQLLCRLYIIQKNLKQQTK